MIKKEQVAKYIMIAWDGTELAMGPIIRDQDKTKPIVNVNTIPYQIFMTVLTSIMPHSMETEFKEPDEPWKGE